MKDFSREKHSLLAVLYFLLLLYFYLAVKHFFIRGKRIEKFVKFFRNSAFYLYEQDDQIKHYDLSFTKLHFTQTKLL